MCRELIIAQVSQAFLPENAVELEYGLPLVAALRWLPLNTPDAIDFILHTTPPGYLPCDVRMRLSLQPCKMPHFWDSKMRRALVGSASAVMLLMLLCCCCKVTSVWKRRRSMKCYGQTALAISRPVTLKMGAFGGSPQSPTSPVGPIKSTTACFPDDIHPSSPEASWALSTEPSGMPTQIISTTTGDIPSTAPDKFAAYGMDQPIKSFSGRVAAMATPGAATVERSCGYTFRGTSARSSGRRGPYASPSQLSSSSSQAVSPTFLSHPALGFDPQIEPLRLIMSSVALAQDSHSQVGPAVHPLNTFDMHASNPNSFARPPRAQPDQTFCTWDDCTLQEDTITAAHADDVGCKQKAGPNAGDTPDNFDGEVISNNSGTCNSDAQMTTKPISAMLQCAEVPPSRSCARQVGKFCDPTMASAILPMHGWPQGVATCTPGKPFYSPMHCGVVPWASPPSMFPRAAHPVHPVHVCGLSPLHLQAQPPARVAQHGHWHSNVGTTYTPPTHDELAEIGTMRKREAMRYRRAMCGHTAGNKHVCMTTTHGVSSGLGPACMGLPKRGSSTTDLRAACLLAGRLQHQDGVSSGLPKRGNSTTDLRKMSQRGDRAKEPSAARKLKGRERADVLVRLEAKGHSKRDLNKHPREH
jgi:hypothetical protein